MLPDLPPGITQPLSHLRQLCQQTCQSQWHLGSEALLTNPQAMDDLPLAPLNEKGYVVWPKGGQVQWLAQRLVIPTALAGYPLQGLVLRLALTWWATDAQIFVQGNLVQAGDLFDSKARIMLSPSATPGDVISVVLRLVSPGHDIGGLMQSRLLFERDYPELDPGFIADELEVLACYLAVFDPNPLHSMACGFSRAFGIAVAGLDWSRVHDRHAFDQSLADLRQGLLPLAEAVGLKNRVFHLLGHAHLDMAWLWPLAETWEVGERTFRSVLKLQQEFPDLIFGHTSPVLYQWIEEHRPELFADIRQAVKNGRWELLGGMWVEPDVNLISGESLVRQLLYGQRYFQSRFGQPSRVAWLPDSFGFCAQLPQLCQQAGIDFFVTGKLHWNDTTKFPHGAFYWRSPDGTELLTLMSPPNVAGVMDTQPLVMTNYALDWEEQTGLQTMLWLPGVGDHGGGPSRDMWEVKKRWQASPFFPKIESSTAENYLQQVKQCLAQSPQSPPTWEQDLYLEFHRGCYTSHADQKAYNRQSENLLYEAELWSACASLLTPTPYPQSELEASWKKVLLNQFHDILPGTSIPEVFVSANQDWQTAIAAGKDLIDRALEMLTSAIAWGPPPHPQAKPLVIFNPLPGDHSAVLELPEIQGHWQICDLEGRAAAQQLSHKQTLLFWAEAIPSLGYQGYWLVPNAEPNGGNPLDSGFTMDNGRLRVAIDPKTGDISSLIDLAQGRELLSHSGNQLQFFRDQGQYWDAWNIDPDYAQQPLPGAKLVSMTMLENGPLRWRIQVVQEFQQSTFWQDYSLERDSPLLKIETQVDWQERHVLVKASFPLTLQSDIFTTERPCAVAEYPTEPKTKAEKAQWEVPQGQWLDLSDPEQNYGLSILNDSKYGCDAKPSQLRLTLLRGSTWPDPGADIGLHDFTYALYPHAQGWRDAHTVEWGYRLNRALRAFFPQGTNSKGTLPPSQSLISLGSEHLMPMALKRHEEKEQQWTLRVYEYQGRSAQFNLTNHLSLVNPVRINLLEEKIDGSDIIAPWAIASFSLNTDV